MGIITGIFKAARFGADVRALSKGPWPFVARQIRKPVYRKVNGRVGSLFRKIGL